ncbi:MAG: hypothetical protein WD602_08345 [Actinomycetota bacterium]
MGMATKLSLVGAVGAAGLAALGGAIAAYQYFMDSDLGAKRRKTAIETTESLLGSFGLDNVAKGQMESLMQNLAGAGNK